MGWLAAPWHDYPDAAGFQEAWDGLARRANARTSVAGYSVQGRPIPRYDFGQGVPVLLTGLMHGVEFVGSMALLDFVRAAVENQADLLRHARLIVMPIVNPGRAARELRAPGQEPACLQALQRPRCRPESQLPTPPGRHAEQPSRRVPD